MSLTNLHFSHCNMMLLFFFLLFKHTPAFDGVLLMPHMIIFVRT